MALPDWWPSKHPWIIDDCMNVMAKMPDKCVDLVLTDPPYGIGLSQKTEMGYKGFNVFKKSDWDNKIPDVECFNELFRVSKNQIIFGGNYYGLPPTRCVIVWDKGEGFYERTFAECEVAWTSFNQNSKIFKHDPLANGDYKGKQHIAQKPVPLIIGILEKYSNPGDIIFDPFLGSGTTLLACRKTGRIGLGCEINPVYEPIIRKRSMQDITRLDMFGVE